MSADLPLLTCFNCNARVEATVRARYEGPYEGDDEMGRGTHWILLQCRGCDGIFLIEQGFQHYGFETSWDESRQLYPQMVSTGLGTGAVPSALRSRMDGARRVFSMGEYEATVMYVRKALEVLSLDLGAPKKPNLSKKLKWLQANGKFDERLYKWADQLRLVGNDGAHDVDRTPSHQDASDALDFLNALVDNVYVLVAKYDAFVSRRESDES